MRAKTTEAAQPARPLNLAACADVLGPLHHALEGTCCRFQRGALVGHVEAHMHTQTAGLRGWPTGFVLAKDGSEQLCGTDKELARNSPRTTLM